VPSPAITAIRFLIATLLFTPFVWNRYRDEIRRLSRRYVLAALTAGALLSLQLTTNFESYRLTSILIAGVLTGSVPLWTALIERFLMQTYLGRAVWIGLALALIGGVLIGLSGNAESAGSQPLVGAGLALAGALLGAVYLNIGRTIRSHVSFVPFVWLVFGSGALAALVTLLIGGYSLTGYSAEGYFWVLMAALLPQIVAHSAFSYTLAFIPATLISMSGQLVTVISAIVAFFIFAELPALLQIVGSTVIAIGVILAITRSSSKER
jgi:drug/metabolite transporter (DMT)-like permease